MRILCAIFSLYFYSLTCAFAQDLCPASGGCNMECDISGLCTFATGNGPRSTDSYDIIVSSFTELSLDIATHLCTPSNNLSDGNGIDSGDFLEVEDDLGRTYHFQNGSNNADAAFSDCFVTGATSVTLTITLSTNRADECIDINESYNSYSGGATSCVILDAEIVSFTAKLKENKVVFLKWLTVSEVDNDYFSIERSLDGENYLEIGQVTGYGTTQQTQSYQFIDRYPAFGNNYYRLKQIDLDGKFTYSPVRVINRSIQEAIIYNNPVEDNLAIKLTEYNAQPLNVILSNTLGQQLLSTTINPNESEAILNLSKLQNGYYILSFLTVDRLTSLKILKQSVD